MFCYTRQMAQIRQLLNWAISSHAFLISRTDLYYDIHIKCRIVDFTLLIFLCFVVCCLAKREDARVVSKYDLKQKLSTWRHRWSMKRGKATKQNATQNATQNAHRRSKHTHIVLMMICWKELSRVVVWRHVVSSVSRCDIWSLMCV